MVVPPSAMHCLSLDSIGSPGPYRYTCHRVPSMATKAGFTFPLPAKLGEKQSVLLHLQRSGQQYLTQRACCLSTCSSRMKLEMGNPKPWQLLPLGVTHLEGKDDGEVIEGGCGLLSVGSGLHFNN